MSISFANLHEHTPAEIFDTAVAGMRAQQFQPSTTCILPGHPTPAYRGDDGHKCPIGYLMTDEEYQRIDTWFRGHPCGRPEVGLEGRGIGTLLTHHVTQEIPRKIVDLCFDLQEAHDSASNAQDMRLRLPDVRRSAPSIAGGSRLGWW